MSDSEEKLEHVSIENMVAERDKGEIEVAKDGIFEILQEKESGVIRKQRHPKKRYSRRWSRAPVRNCAKTNKYTIKMYDSEYEILKVQAQQLNVSIQYIIDMLLIDGFIARDKRIIDFMNEKIREELLDDSHRFNKVEQFSTLEIDELVAKIENNDIMKEKEERK